MTERIELEIEGQIVIVELLEDGTFRKPVYLMGAEREVVGYQPYTMPKADNTMPERSYGICGGTLAHGATAEKIAAPITAPATDAAKLWEGWGSCGLKPAFEPILLCRKPLTTVQFDSIIVATQNLIGGLLCLLLSNVNNAEMISKLIPNVLNEVSVSALVLVAVLHGGKSGELLEKMDMFNSQEMVSMCLSIAILWSTILDELLRPGNTFTTSMVSEMTTDLRTLNCLLSTNIPAGVIQDVSHPVGSQSHVPIVENPLSEEKKNTSDIQRHFAAALVSLHTSRNGTLVKSAASNLRQIIPTVVFVLNHVRRLITTASGVTGSREFVSTAEKSSGQFHRELPSTVIRSVWPQLIPDYSSIILAMKPLDGRYVDNALKWGVAGIWVDGGRIATNDVVGASGRWGFKQEKGWNASSIPSETQTTYEHTKGRWPANLILSHSSDRECFCAGNWAECPYCNGTGIVEGCKRVGTKRVKGSKERVQPKTKTYHGGSTAGVFVPSEGLTTPGYADKDGLETIPVWDCVEDCAIKMLNRQSGTCGGRWGRQTTNECKSMFGNSKASKRGEDFIGDTGGASRFFLNLEGETRFFYCPKSSRRERNEGLEGMDMKIGGGLNATVAGDSRTGKRTIQQNNHPTVKPRKLLEYLCRLTRTPTGGTVLDPFMGSGTTGLAAIKTDRDFIGIELDPSYFEIAEQRIESERAKMKQLELSGI